MKNGNKLRIIIIISALLMLTAIGYLIYANQSQKKSLEEGSQKLQEITNELLALEESNLELEILFQDKDAQVKERTELLRQKYQELGYLEEEVDKLKRLRSMDQQKIRELEEKLAEARKQLDDFAVMEIEFLQAELGKKQVLIDSVTKDFDRIRMDNDRLRQQVITLGGNVTVTNPNPDNNAGNEVQLPFATDFKFFNNQKDGLRKQAVTFPIKDMNQIEVCYTLRGGINVPVGDYDLYLVYQHPDGTITYNTEFRADGNQKMAAATKTVHLDAKVLNVCMKVDLGSDPFLKGTQKIQVYCKGEIIGEGEFMIQ